MVHHAYDGTSWFVSVSYVVFYPRLVVRVGVCYGVFIFMHCACGCMQRPVYLRELNFSGLSKWSKVSETNTHSSETDNDVPNDRAWTS